MGSHAVAYEPDVDKAGEKAGLELSQMFPFSPLPFSASLSPSLCSPTLSEKDYLKDSRVANSGVPLCRGSQLKIRGPKESFKLPTGCERSPGIMGKGIPKKPQIENVNTEHLP